HPLGDFLNPALALLGQGLKKSPIGQKLDFANHPYLCKGPKKFVKFIFAKRNCAKKKLSSWSCLANLHISSRSLSCAKDTLIL
ncbi:hypothetical protein BSPCLSOX_2447, partial [uncultured Gammaproteobacteria bacterium]